MFKRTLVSLFLVFTILLTLGVSAVSGAPPAAEVLAQEEMTYTVKLGDSLWALAEKYLGSGPDYWAIVDATNAKHEENASFAHIEDPGLINPGWKLLIPGAEQEPIPISEGAVIPFEAHYQTHPREVANIGGIRTLAILGNGEDTLLNRSVWSAGSTVDFTSGAPPFVQLGHMWFVADNGDWLEGTFEGTVVPVDADTVAFEGEYEITGGTGRLSGITGSGTFSGTASGDAGELSFVGTLTR